MTFHLELRVRCIASCAHLCALCLSGLTFLGMSICLRSVGKAAAQPNSRLPSLSLCEQVPHHRQAKYLGLVHRALLQLAAAADPLVSPAGAPPPWQDLAIAVTMTSVRCSWSSHCTSALGHSQLKSLLFYSPTYANISPRDCSHRFGSRE